MENYFHQEIVVFEDDTIVIEFPLEVIEFNNVYNVASTDNVWFGISSTPGGTYIQQYANANWDQGILNGNAYDYSNADDITGGTQDDYSVSPTSVSPTGGTGAILTTQINEFGNINSAVFSFTNGGHNYQAGDVLTFDSSLFGSDQDLIVTLDEDFFPLLPQPDSSHGVIKIVAPEGPNGPATVKLEIRQDSFQASGGPLVTDTTYYWELVVGEPIFNAIWGDLNTIATQVVATGELYVSSSLFSSAGYRP